MSKNDMDNCNIFTSIIDAIDAVPRTLMDINNMFKSEFLLPNIPLKILDTDTRLWDTLSEYKGWRLQQNEFTRHCRIVDPEGWRRAWGTKNGMKKALKELGDSIQK